MEHRKLSPTKSRPKAMTETPQGKVGPLLKDYQTCMSACNYVLLRTDLNKFLRAKLAEAEN